MARYAYACACLLGTFAVTACSLLVDTGGLSGATAIVEAGMADAAPLDADVADEGSTEVPADGAPDGGMIALAQTATQACASCGTATATPSQDLSNGSLLIAFLYTCAPPDGNCPTPTIADALGNSWSGPRIVGTANEGANYMWYTCGSASGHDAVTITRQSATYGLVLVVHEVRGIAASGCLDAVGTNTGTGTTATVVTSTAVSSSNEYLVAFFAKNGSGGPSTFLPGSGFALSATASSPGNDTAISETFNGQSGFSGVQTATATQTTPSSTWQATVATFRAAP